MNAEVRTHVVRKRRLSAHQAAAWTGQRWRCHSTSLGCSSMSEEQLVARTSGLDKAEKQ